MVAGFQRHLGYGEGNHSFGMTVHDSSNMGMSLIDLRMNHTFSVSLGRSLIERLGVLNSVADEVTHRGDRPRCNATRHDEHVGLVGVSERDMAVCIEDVVVVENMRAVHKFPIIGLFKG
jgi:hypothetical protein